MVVLANGPPQSSTPRSSTPPSAQVAETTPPKVSPVPAHLREKFRRECLELFATVAVTSLPLNRFLEVFNKHFGRSLVLDDYGAKKIAQLFQAVSDTVNVSTLLMR